MIKKVLILIGDVGNGHRSAANALTEAFLLSYPEVTVITHDVFKESNLWPYKTTDEMYKKVSKSKSLEKVNNAGFKFTNQKYIFDVFTNYTYTQLVETTQTLIQKESPDVVISIHPIISMVMERLKDSEPTKFLSIVVVTDLITLYRGWADSAADLIFSPTIDAVNTLAKFGVDKNKIAYPLFPLNPKLKNYRPKNEVFSEFKFNSDVQTILITGGGVGAKSLNSSIERLSKRKDLQLIIIAGKLQEYKEQLEKKYLNNPNIKVLGFVNNIQDYINASDIIIGKPGPATILEIELFDKKAILTRKIGEQEIGNIDYAIRNPKFRYIGDNWGKLEEAIDELTQMKNIEVPKLARRSFDESELIVKEIVKLAQNRVPIDNPIKQKRTLEKFLATTVAVSAVSLGIYKLIRTLSKK